MKKTMLLLSLLFTIYILVGCTQYEKQNESVATRYISYDCDAFGTPEEIARYVDNIYEGTVTRIYFDTLNTLTGNSDKNWSSSGASQVELFTIYEIEVKTTFKGNERKKRAVAVLGGTNEYDIDGQYKVLNNAGMDYRAVSSDLTTLKVGETYLFVTVNGPTEKEYNYNPSQYAFCIDDSNVAFGVNYSRMKEYLMSDTFARPEYVLTNYIESRSEVIDLPDKIVEMADNVYEGLVYSVAFKTRNINGTPKLYTVYSILVSDTYKGEQHKVKYIYVEGGTNEYDIKEQYRVINESGICSREVYKDLTTLKIGEKYVFVTDIGPNDQCDYISKPAQFAFCSDNSNAPGGVDYKMMKEYLEK